MLHAVQGLLGGSGLSVQAEPSGSVATEQDFGERSAVNVVAGGTLEGQGLEQGRHPSTHRNSAQSGLDGCCSLSMSSGRGFEDVGHPSVRLPDKCPTGTVTAITCHRRNPDWYFWFAVTRRDRRQRHGRVYNSRDGGT